MWPLSRLHFPRPTPATQARRARLTIPSGRITRLPQGVSSILLSWVFSPVLTGGLSFLLFGLLRTLVLRSPRAYHRAYYVLPLFVFITTFVIRCLVWDGSIGAVCLNASRNASTHLQAAVHRCCMPCAR